MIRPLSLAILLPAVVVTVATLAQCGAEPKPTALPQDPPSAAQVPAEDRIRLLVSGAMLGRLEPCGCASGQLGGLPRRMQHIGEQREHDLRIEGGDLVAGNSELDLLKAMTAMQVLFGMQRPYDVLGVGAQDLALPLPEWTAFLATTTAVATDLQATQEDWPCRPYLEKQVRQHTVRVLSFTMQLPASLQREDSPVKLLPPIEAWQKGLAGADPKALRVLLLHCGEQAAKDLLPKLAPPPDLALCFDPGYTEPPAHPTLVGGVPLVFPGIRGRMLLDVTLARLPSGPRVGYEVVPLQGSKTVPGGGGDPDVKLVLQNHREQVKQDQVLERLANQHPTANGATYVGSATCAGCHPTAMAAWQGSRHGRAWQTLVDAEADPKRYGWPVTAYPDCVSCHVVGYGEQTGFVSPTQTPHLTDVGCERCHGAGSAHAQSNGQQRLGLIGGVAASILCAQCHDFEQSPDFLYSDKWPRIQHGREPKK